MTIELRIPPATDFRPWIDAVETAFGETMDEERWTEFQRLLDRERVLAAYDGERIVGGGGILGFELTVPGGTVPAAGVTAVGVLPTHRRQGILRRLMAQQLDDAAAAGEPVAILWASEGSIYQRFGYGLASRMATVRTDPTRAVFRDTAPPAGTVRLLDRDEAARRLPPIHDRIRRWYPGMFARSETYFEVELLTDRPSRRGGAGPKIFAVYERDGSDEGYAIYRTKSEWDHLGAKSELRIIEVLAETPEAERDLWRYLLSIDLIARIDAELAPIDHPLILQLAEPRRVELLQSDALWLRIIDLPAALAARGYASDGQLVLDVTDTFRPTGMAAGRWRLSVEGGRGSVEPTSDPAELTVDVTDLAAVYLGAFTFAQLARAVRTTELVPGSRVRADRLFATERQPWCPRIF